MKILGLTGSIGMGKSAVARLFRRLGVPVHDADKTIHQLLAGNQQVILMIDGAFSGVVQKGAVDRQALAKKVIGNSSSMALLEKILHPLAQGVEKRFLLHAAAQKQPLVVLDIPLLYETGAEKRCDAVVVVSAPLFVQRARVLKRPGMTEERLEFLSSRQIADGEKRRRADFIVQTGLGFAFSFRAVKKIVKLALQNGQLKRSLKRQTRFS